MREEVSRESNLSKEHTSKRGGHLKSNRLRGELGLKFRLARYLAG